MFKCAFFSPKHLVSVSYTRLKNTSCCAVIDNGAACFKDVKVQRRDFCIGDTILYCSAQILV